MKLALYATKYNPDGVVYQCGKFFDEEPEYVRLSEEFEIEFVMRPIADVTVERVKSIENQIEEEGIKHTLKITDLEDQKQRLMAITQETT